MNRFNQLISPRFVYRCLNRLLPWCLGLSVVFLLLGMGLGLFGVPPDYQQGDGFRMIYIHVPTAFLSLGIYSIIFCCSVVYLVWSLKIADICAKASASVGALYTLMALVSGALWGKPMWGTWWIWDARLTSELVLLFLYWSYLGLRLSIREEKRAAKASALLTIVGMIDIPLIHFSVEWWTTLHQGATLLKFSKPSIATEMLIPLLIMLAGFSFFYATILCIRMRSELLKREWRSLWVSEILLNIQLDTKA
jgi:heme exporter protein C